MIIPLLYYLTMLVWVPRNAIERLQLMLGLTIFTAFGPFINICVTVYAIFNMSNFGWGKTRQVITEAETGEAEEPIADEQHTRFEEALNCNEKVVNSQVPDEENQLGGRAATPFTAPVPRIREPKQLNGAQSEQRAITGQSMLPGPYSTNFPVPGRARRPDNSRQTDDISYGRLGPHTSTSSSGGRDSFTRTASSEQTSSNETEAGSASGGPLEAIPGPLNINRARYSDHSLNLRHEDFQLR